MIGTPAEYKGRLSEGSVVIGNNNMINEHVTIHAAVDHLDYTSISNDCYIMTKAHIGHDAQIESEVTLSSLSIVGGHSIVMRGANIGLGAVIHQKRVVGNFAMVGMNSTVSRSLPPFFVALGSPAKIYKVNKLGLERRKFDAELIEACQAWLDHLLGGVLRNVPRLQDAEEYIERWSNRVEMLEDM